MQSKMISFYSVCKEMFEEQGMAGSFENYYDMQKKRYKEILSSVGIDVDNLKSEERGSILVAESKKENVKNLLLQYTEKTMKYIRMKQYSDIPNELLNEVIGEVEEIVTGTLEGAEQNEEIGRMYMVTRVKLDEAIEHLKQNAIKRIQEDLENLRTFARRKGKLRSVQIEGARMLSENDKIALVECYESILDEARERFNWIAREVEDRRNAELIELSEVDSIGGQREDDSSKPQKGSRMQNIDVLISAAMIEYEKKYEEDDGSTDEELDEVGKIIEQMLQDRIK